MAVPVDQTKVVPVPLWPPPAQGVDRLQWCLQYLSSIWQQMATKVNGLVSVPSGGTAGQVLVKTSGTNYDTAWVTPSTLAFSGAKVPLTAPWTIAPTDGNWHPPAWGTPLYDTQSYWTAPAFKVPVAGYYQVQFSCAGAIGAFAAAAHADVGFTVNGADYAYGFLNGPTVGTVIGATGHFNANDLIEAVVATTYTTAITLAATVSWFSIARLGT
jgi:hypothetical protein